MYALQEQYAPATDSGSETISRFAFAIFASSIFAAAGAPLSAPVFFALFLAPIATALVFLWASNAATGIVPMLSIYRLLGFTFIIDGESVFFF